MRTQMRAETQKRRNTQKYRVLPSHTFGIVTTRASTFLRLRLRSYIRLISASSAMISRSMSASLFFSSPRRASICCSYARIRS